MTTLTTGKAGEDFAAKHLRKLGWRILERNWRCGPLELDIIGAHKGVLIFVEVKTRAAKGLTRPDEALTPLKRDRLGLQRRHPAGGAQHPLTGFDDA